MVPAVRVVTACAASRDCRSARWSQQWSSCWPDSLLSTLCGTSSGLRSAMLAASAFFAGLVFGIGLPVSLMVNPAKVLGFLDPARRWGPSLSLVMAGAIAMGILAFGWPRER